MHICMTYIMKFMFFPEHRNLSCCVDVYAFWWSSNCWCCICCWASVMCHLLVV